MYPQKQPINIDFSKGLNLKVDPYQVPVGNFLSLVNTVFDKVGRLTKRNGFAPLTPLPMPTSYLTTFNGDLQALGENLLSYSAGQGQWLNKGSTYPITLSTMPLIRNAVEQVQTDVAIASNGVICTVYTETNGTTTTYKYALADSVTGQNIVAPTLIPPGAGTITNAPRVFLLGNNFIILFENIVSSIEELQYVAISSMTGTVIASDVVVSASFTNSTTLAYDAAVAGSTMYIAWNGGASSGIKVTSLSQQLVLGSTVNPDPAHSATIMSVTVDVTQSIPTVWLTYYDSATTVGYTMNLNGGTLATILPPTGIMSPTTVSSLTSAAQNMVNTIVWEVDNFYDIAHGYSINSSIPSHYVQLRSITQTGSTISSFVSARSVGLASKAFIVNGVVYYLAAYQSPYQPTYFLIDASTSTEAAPIVVARLAYSNGGGYLTTGLPNAVVIGNTVQIPYLYKDLLEAQAPAAAQSIDLSAPQVYTQTGVNLVTFNFTTDGLVSAEIGNTLQLSGGFLWMYDGYEPVEQNFFLWPDSINAAGSATPGSMTPQQYYYQVTYEWTDNQGNLHRSAPSIPVTVTLTSDTSVTLGIPFLRLTYKVITPVRIVIYRWSTENPVYYQVTSITQPLQNNTDTDAITYNDGLADSAIIGNNIIYTTGGVIEDIGAPSTNIMALFDDRLWLVDAEDPNLLWYSKQVIEATPVEMSDVLTFYVAPSTGAEGSTGDITSLYPLDDKLIIFKSNAIYYINGTGPDNTGANSGYSQPIFITSAVGCENIRSIVLMPNGLMFQSASKGIWLLGRDLSTTYVGDAVEDFNAIRVNSAVSIPSSNQVRFALDSGVDLMYDYYVKQWGEFEGKPSVSSTLYNKYQTIVDQYGNVYQESPGTYLDGSNPVLMSFTTSWLQLAGLRGYMRAYWFYLLGTYLSPHKLNLSIAYDYNSSPVQSNLIAPINYAPPYGSDPFYGGDGATPYGGPSNIEQWRIVLDIQRCKSFQISMQEVFDPTFGTVAGPGLTLSGLNCIVGLKKAYAPIPQNQQVG